MFRTPLLAGIIAILCFSSASAQGANMIENSHTINVTGEATVSVKPDKVQITLGIESSESTVAAAKAVNDTAAAKVLAVTRDFHIDAKDVQTDHISIEPQYDNQNGHRIVHPTSYLVRKSMVITLHDVAGFDAFLSAAVDSGANVVLDVQFLTSDLRKHRDEARVMAMKAAREKADLLSGALGQKTGKATHINETSNNFYPMNNRAWGSIGGPLFQNTISNGALGAGAADETTAPGEAKVSVSVNATFLLE